MKIKINTNTVLLALKAIVCLMFLQVSTSYGAVTCEELFPTEFRFKAVTPGKFLHQISPQTHTSEVVENVVKSLKNKTKIVLTKPPEKVMTWINYLEKVSIRSMGTEKVPGNDNVTAQIKKFYADLHVTKITDVPESFYDLQIKIAREQGHGNLTMSTDQRRESAQASLNDQRKSLDSWLDYFLSKDSEAYPMWAKYWSFNGLVKLGKFNPETGSFGNRTIGQMSPFPELNREAFAYVIDAMIKKLNGTSLESIKDPGFLNLLETNSFGKLYGYALNKATSQNVNAGSVEGQWRHYKQGSDHMPLVKSLEGKNTGWCTAGESTARAHLSGGDFHVFYSKDEKGEMTIPRVAIRMQGNEISEVRGVAKDQNLDHKIAESNVVKDKLKEFGSKGDAYNKKSQNMQKLTEIEKQHKAGQELSADQLRFLYQIDEKAEGFGNKEDPRIKEITDQRNLRVDLAKVFGVAPSQLSLTTAEALGGGILYHYGDLDLTGYTSVKGLILPEILDGNLWMNGLTSAEGLILPKIKGSLELNGLKSARGLILPEILNGNLWMNGLTSAEGLVFPKIKSSLYLNGLTSAKGLILPKIKGRIELNGLKSAKDLILPKNMPEEGFHLNGLTSAIDLILPEILSGNLWMNGLTSAEGLVLPKIMSGNILLNGLTSAKGLILPKTMSECNLSLDGLTSAEGLILPKNIRTLSLGSITSAHGLILPENISGILGLKSLTSAKGLIFPKSIGAHLVLNSLTSMEGVILPESIGAGLSLSGLESAQGLILPKLIGGSVILDGLTSKDGLILPEGFDLSKLVFSKSLQ